MGQPSNIEAIGICHVQLLCRHRCACGFGVLIQVYVCGLPPFGYSQSQLALRGETDAQLPCYFLFTKQQQSINPGDISGTHPRSFSFFTWWHLHRATGSNSPISPRRRLCAAICSLTGGDNFKVDINYNDKKNQRFTPNRTNQHSR